MPVVRMRWASSCDGRCEAGRVKIIVGLGNPGPQYRGTRHNVGFMVLDCLAAHLNTAFRQEKYSGLIARADTDDGTLLLVKPLTFMNNSGECVALVTRHNLQSLADLLVVVDDVYLPLGKLRLRRSGTAGGHNGLKSLIERLGTNAFARLRLGVGEDKTRDDLAGYVLGRFTAEEKPIVEKMVEGAANAIECFLGCGIDRAMDELN